MTPQGQFLAQPLGLAQDFLGSPLVVPEAGLASTGVKLG